MIDPERPRPNAQRSRIAPRSRYVLAVLAVVACISANTVLARFTPWLNLIWQWPNLGSPPRRLATGDYFNDVLIEAKELLSVVPSPFTAAIIARLMPAAINRIRLARGIFNMRPSFKMSLRSI